MDSLSFPPDLISFLPILEGKLAFLLLKVNCTAHAAVLTPSYLLSSLLHKLFYSICSFPAACHLHKHSQVEEPCLNPLLSTTYTTFSWQLYSLKEQSLSVTIWHTHVLTSDYFNWLKPLIAPTSTECTLARVRNDSPLILFTVILLVLSMSANIVEDSFPLGTFPRACKHYFL